MYLEDDVALYLQSNGVGAVGISIFKHELPPEPDLAVLITVYAGLSPVRTHVRNQIDPPTLNYEQPRFQIKVRAGKEDLATARAQAQLAYGLLARIKNATVNGSYYQSIEPVQSPYFLRWDENRRAEYVFNCDVYRSYIP